MTHVFVLICIDRVPHAKVVVPFARSSAAKGDNESDVVKELPLPVRKYTDSDTELCKLKRFRPKPVSALTGLAEDVHEKATYHKVKIVE